MSAVSNSSKANNNSGPAPVVPQKRKRHKQESPCTEPEGERCSSCQRNVDLAPVVGEHIKVFTQHTVFHEPFLIDFPSLKDLKHCADAMIRDDSFGPARLGLALGRCKLAVAELDEIVSSGNFLRHHITNDGIPELSYATCPNFLRTCQILRVNRLVWDFVEKQKTHDRFEIRNAAESLAPKLAANLMPFQKVLGVTLALLGVLEVATDIHEY